MLRPQTWPGSVLNEDPDRFCMPYEKAIIEGYVFLSVFFNLFGNGIVIIGEPINELVDLQKKSST